MRWTLYEAKVKESLTDHGVTASTIAGTGDRTANLVWRYRSRTRS